MTTITDATITIQSTPQSMPSTPCWFGEVLLMATYLRKHSILTKISEQVRFARRRFGHYEVIDFVAVLFGYTISGEPTLEAFYERLQPFAVAFMAVFERDRLPSRSALSRFLAALTPEPVEALRTLFLNDLLERRADFEQQPCTTLLVSPRTERLNLIGLQEPEDEILEEPEQHLSMHARQRASRHRGGKSLSSRQRQC